MVYFISMKTNYSANILKLYVKLNLILSSKIPFTILLSYLVTFLSYKTHTIHNKKHFSTSNFCTLCALPYILEIIDLYSSSWPTTEPPSLHTILLCSAQGTLKKGRFLGLTL